MVSAGPPAAAISNTRTVDVHPILTKHELRNEYLMQQVLVELPLVPCPGRGTSDWAERWSPEGLSQRQSRNMIEIQACHACVLQCDQVDKPTHRPFIR